MTPADSVLGGRYRLLSPIAAGGMGEVWRAADELLGREVAIKLLGRHIAADPSFQRRFRAEAQITAGLTDGGIAQVFDYGETDDVAYLVMELVKGEPLSAILARNGALGPEVTLDIVHQAARGLHAAHRAGIIHRDIKPGNILVTETGQVKITDFGIARALEAAPLTQTGLVLGTAQYVSPEQASGATLTPASDIYSLGVVAYECLAGRPPFVADNHVTLALRHLNDPPPPLPDAVPAAVRALVLAMLAKDPAARPASGPDLLDHVRALRDRLAGPGTAVLGGLTDSRGFPVAGGTWRDGTNGSAPASAPTPPFGASTVGGIGGGAGRGGPSAGGTGPTDRFGASAGSAHRAADPYATSAAAGSAWTDPFNSPAAGRPGPSGPGTAFAGGRAAGDDLRAAPARRRRPAVMFFAVAGCAVAIGAGALAWNARTDEATPGPAKTTTPTPSASARPSHSPSARTSRPVAPVPSDEPTVVPSATVKTSAPPTRKPTPTPTPTPEPSDSPTSEPSDSPIPTDAPTDTSSPDEGT
ncbi:protein kinase [Microbispora sp. NPDC049125]|uniref:serine/threonine-protein kinase n=1 Tax=Microbispora sp. NPDC049125 TaxID=3154929 RepID=UPI00346748F5